MGFLGFVGFVGLVAFVDFVGFVVSVGFVKSLINVSFVADCMYALLGGILRCDFWVLRVLRDVLLGFVSSF